MTEAKVYTCSVAGHSARVTFVSHAEGEQAGLLDQAGNCRSLKPLEEQNIVGKFCLARSSSLCSHWPTFACVRQLATLGLGRYIFVECSLAHGKFQRSSASSNHKIEFVAPEAQPSGVMTLRHPLRVPSRDSVRTGDAVLPWARVRIDSGSPAGPALAVVFLGVVPLASLAASGRQAPTCKQTIPFALLHKPKNRTFGEVSDISTTRLVATRKRRRLCLGDKQWTIITETSCIVTPEPGPKRARRA